MFMLSFFGLLGKGLNSGAPIRANINTNQQSIVHKNAGNPQGGQYDPSKGRKREWYDQ